MRNSVLCLCVLVIACCCPGCNPGSQSIVSHPALERSTARMEAVSLNDPALPVRQERGAALASARNEWTAFVLRVSDLPSSSGYWVRIHEPQLETSNASLPLSSFEASQILSMPVDLDRAGFVRHTGLTTSGHDLPRALFPASVDSSGVLNLRTLRDPARPLDPATHPGGIGSRPILLWIDLHIPKTAAAGDYAGHVDLMREGEDKPVESVPLQVKVYDVDLPDESHLQMLGELNWDRLVQLYPDRFEAVTPRLINRTDSRYADTVKTLDQLMTLAQKHRTAVFIPRLQPTVKWAERGEPPQIDWKDFDPLVAPWLSGDLFENHVPLAYWPLPAPDLLGNWNRSSQLAYWSSAATHFDQLDWLGKMAVSLPRLTPGRAGTQESLELSAQAAEILGTHSRISVMLPLEDDQIQFASASNKKLVESSTTSRLMAAAPSLVFAAPQQAWPTGVKTPRRWLRTDLPGLLPYVGAGGDEHDVRTWAFLAFLRRAEFVLWDSTLPTVSNPTDAADPNELIWFYPGHWFGVAEPVPTLQLKWLRRAEQDYEYLYMARERGEVINAIQMARLITKPVQILPEEAPDPIYSLMSGTTDPVAWKEAERLLAQTILIRQPQSKVDPAQQHELYIQTLQWARPQERPMLIARGSTWSWDAKNPQQDQINLRLTLDVYNASEDTPGGNVLEWSSLPTGWEITPQPLSAPNLETYRVSRLNIEAKFDANHLSAAARLPLELDFVDGFTKVASPLRVSVPVAASDRREGRLSVDGSMDDWTVADELQNGPMVVMLNRPALQRQEMQRASVNSKVFSAWTDRNFYVAFSLEGLSEAALRHAQNFVTYKDRRAWGEDLCEVLVQPLYADGSAGRLLHIVCKPNGGIWVERKADARLSVKEWDVVEGAAVRYAATTGDGGKWNGELAIPWKLIGDESRGLPSLLRFNFSQHRTSTGQSASWCGPVDFGRDEALMGVIYLRAPDMAGASQIVRGKAE